MKKIKLLIMLLLLLCGGIVFAYDGITFYGAEISNRDRYNSNGERLTTVRDILRQDRANYYKFGLRDPVDQSDGYFKTKEKRSLFDSARITISPELASRIVNGGSVLISVFVLTPNQIDVQPGLPTPGVD